MLAALATAVMFSWAAYGRPAGIAAGIFSVGFVILRGRAQVSSADGWVYLLHCPTLGAWKIGYSGHPMSPTARVQTLIGQSREPVRLVCYGQGSRLLEQALHDRFRPKRVSTTLPAPTEWFALDKSEAAEVAALLKGRR